MKKIKKLFLFMITIIGALFSITNVEAKSDHILHGDKISGPYYVMHSKVEHNMWFPGQFLIRESDGHFVYCIQPFVSINEDSTYNVTSDDISTIMNMDQNVWNTIATVAYYGYGYKENGYNHTSDKWYLATQMLIWNLSDKSVDSYFTKTLKGERDDSILKTEMDEIMKLANSHLKKPSFNSFPTEMSLGDTITLTDTNDVLNNYTVNNIKNADINVNGNKLTITATGVGNIEFVLRKKCNIYNEPIELYYALDSQNVLKRGDLDPININKKIKVNGGKVEIQKVDFDRNTNQAQGESTLKGAKYGVYTKEGSLLETLTTDEKGYAISGYLPSLGEYYVKEISASKGYLIDNNKYNFTIAKDNLNIKITSKEQVIKNYISILKQYDYVDGNTTFLNAEQGINFEIHDIKNNLVKIITTDKNGYATTNLAYGKYKFHQVNSNVGYEKIYDFYVTVYENSNKEQYYNILNNKLSAYLQVFKIDSETKEKIVISNTTFKILNTDTNQYVSQYVSGKIYDKFTTDEEGKFITYLKLEAGNYRLIEIDNPKGYLINEDGIEFSISENSEYNYTTYGPMITIYFENKPIKGQIEIIKTGEKFVVRNDSFNYENIPLNEVEFGIYNENHELVEILTTDEKGYAISKELKLGLYYIKELKTLDQYVIDDNEYLVELNEIDNKTKVVYYKAELNNQIKKGNLEFTKTDLVDGKVIPNTKIEIYTDDDELIYSGFTNEEGKVKIENLSIGKYYIIETNPATGYKLNEEKVYFEIKENGEIVKANMTNEKITGTLEFTKVDVSTSEPLPNTLIEIYNELDELVYSGRTDENGKIIIEKLEYGKYYILEKEAPIGYELNSERMYFEILEDGIVVKSTMTDEKIPEEIIDVPITEDNSYIIPISIILFITASGVIIYEEIKKRKNK